MIINSSKDFDRYILENDILIEDSYNIENEDLKILENLFCNYKKKHRN